MTTIKIGQHKVTIGRLTVGDAEELEDKGIDILSGERMTAKQTCVLVHHMVSKSNPSITEADIRAIPINDENILKVVHAAFGAEGNSKDFLAPSSSLPKSGGGESRKSKH
jgi:hypothetical protein